MNQLELPLASRASTICNDKAGSQSRRRPGPTAEREQIERRFAPLMREELGLGALVSYVGNKQIPVLRLYRYKEAFSFRFVETWIERFRLGPDDRLFDPFCGMGTSLLAAFRHNVASIGIDRLPIAVFLARTFPLFLSTEPGLLRETFAAIKRRVDRAEPAAVAMDVGIMRVAFPEPVLHRLRQWKAALDTLATPMRQVFLLLFLAILEPCSYTAKDGQFLRLNHRKTVEDPDEALSRKVFEAERDIAAVRMLWRETNDRMAPVVKLADARDLSGLRMGRSPTAVITSPPYANRYDYTRTYSLELCFAFVKDFGELRTLRQQILRSHIESKLSASEAPPHSVVREVVESLEAQGAELNNPRIPDMLTAYFVDMRRVIRELARVLAPRGKVAMVIDNVRFGGELVPVDLILCEMAEEFGFTVKEIVVARYKGNSSQQMGRYGRVPVRESIVVWEKTG